MPYRIHLKGPWSFEWLSEPLNTPLANSQNLLAGARVRMPCDWQSIFGSAAGRVRFSRRFHRPTNLTADDRVKISFDGVGGAATVSMNDHPLGGVQNNTSTVSFDVTELLGPSNMLVVEVSFVPAEHTAPGGLWGSVAVEIHSPE